MTTEPYCPDQQCIEDECSPTDPCCISICDCARAKEDCRWAGPNGAEFVESDGTVRDIWYCDEHRKEWVR